MKSIWCVMVEDDFEGTQCLGCYPSEEIAKEAYAFWSIGSDELVWLLETKLYKNLRETIKEMDIDET